MALEKTNKVNKSFSAAMMLSMVFAGMHIGTHGNSTIVVHADNVQQNQQNQNGQNGQNSQQNQQTYTVKSGDTLSQIAKDNNTTVDDLKGLNGLNSDLIHPDQQLKVTQQATTYTVKDGDTLSQIAKNNNTTTDNLHKLNNIQDDNKIYVNQQLKLVDDQNQTQQAQPAQQAQPQQTQTANASQLNGTVKQRAVQLAQQFANMNIPYVWGGSTPSGFDCSGLTAYIYGQLGVNIGRNTVAQEGHVTTKAVSQAEPGDLLFWGGHGSTYHVAIYIGNNQYVAAPEPGQNVQVQTINSYFMPSFAGSVNG